MLAGVHHDAVRRRQREQAFGAETIVDDHPRGLDQAQAAHGDEEKATTELTDGALNL